MYLVILICSRLAVYDLHFVLCCFVLIFSFIILPQAITSSGIKKGDLLLGDISTQVKNKNITTDVKVDTNSNVSQNS